MSKQQIEVEGGELAMRNSHGDVVIIPKRDKKRVQQMIDDGCNDCIDSFVNTLPSASDYAEDGSVYPVAPESNPTFQNRGPVKQNYNTNNTGFSSTAHSWGMSRQGNKIPSLGNADKTYMTPSESVSVNPNIYRPADNPSNTRSFESRIIDKDIPSNPIHYVPSADPKSIMLEDSWKTDPNARLTNPAQQEELKKHITSETNYLFKSSNQNKQSISSSSIEDRQASLMNNGNHSDNYNKWRDNPEQYFSILKGAYPQREKETDSMYENRIEQLRHNSMSSSSSYALDAGGLMVDVALLGQGALAKTAGKTAIREGLSVIARKGLTSVVKKGLATLQKRFLSPSTWSKINPTEIGETLFKGVLSETKIGKPIVKGMSTAKKVEKVANLGSKNETESSKAKKSIYKKIGI